MSEDNSAPKQPYFKYVKFGLYALLILIVLGWIYSIQLKADAQSAINNTKTIADAGVNSQFCDIYKQDAFCLKMKEILENPTVEADPAPVKDGEKGAKGDPGLAGRGIVTFDSSTGNLVVKFTDNTTQNLGRIVGKDGKPGTNGKNGTNGTNGDDGRGILAADLKDGALIVSYTDGSFQNVGNIVGPKGDPGEKGDKGDKGDAGVDGVDGKDALMPTSVDTDPSGNVTITYSDGSFAQAGKVILPTVQYFTCEGDTLLFKLTNDREYSFPVDCTPDNGMPPAQQEPQPAPPANNNPTLTIP